MAQEAGVGVGTVRRERSADRTQPGVDRQPLALDGAALPWGYDRDRVTVIVRDPDSAYVYWEIADEAIADARRRLGPGGAGAFCNLRVYDTTGRLFDGANANDFFDVGVRRTDREYFLAVRRPARTVHVEIGLKSHEGQFQPIARSGAAAFPRKEPSPNVAIEWTTVVTDHSHPSTRPYASRFRAAIPAPMDAWQASGSGPDGQGRIVSERGELIRSFPEAARLHRSDPAAFARWAGLLVEGALELLDRFEWHEGPFPVELRGAGGVEIHFAGSGPPVLIERQGVRFLERGPWTVTLRGLDAPSGRRLLGTWSVRWSIASSPLIERWARFMERRRMGAFARGAIGAGASERSAIVEQGASERWRLGASERISMGASERLFLGASEMVLGGATELSLAGASEQQPGGASEAGGRDPWLRDT